MPPPRSAVKLLQDSVDAWRSVCGMKFSLAPFNSILAVGHNIVKMKERIMGIFKEIMIGAPDPQARTEYQGCVPRMTSLKPE